MRTQSRDTPADIERRQIESYRELGPVGRLEVALALNAALDEIACAGIRARHPGISEREERLRLYALRLGAEEVERAFGWREERRVG